MGRGEGRLGLNAALLHAGLEVAQPQARPGSFRPHSSLEIVVAPPDLGRMWAERNRTSLSSEIIFNRRQSFHAKIAGRELVIEPPMKREEQMHLYAAARRRLTSREKARLDATLTAWQDCESGRSVVKSLQTEVFLPITDMVAVLKLLASQSGRGLRAVESQFTEKCRRLKFRGGYIRCPLPKRLGRAVTRETFVDYLREQYSDLFDERCDVEQWIDDGLAGVSTSEGFKVISIGQNLIWVTWDPAEKYGDPFSFRTTDRADEVRSCLGLDLKMKGLPLLLLEYNRREERVGLYRPTVTDAEVWPPFDPPILEFERYGLTRPWPRTAFAKGIDDWEPQARPEAVHRPWSGEDVDLTFKKCLT